jgi:aspartate/methionine/tyrosine aminotransferase
MARARAAERAGIPPFHVMEVLKAAGERERRGGDIVHLEVGQPSTPAPQAVIEAASIALRRDPLGYTDALGTVELRAAIARWYAQRYGTVVEPGHVAVTAGASGGCLLAFLACFEAGDRVAVASPGYPCYRHILRALDVEAVEVPVGPGTRWQLSPGLLDAAAEGGALAGVVVASPSNPTGTMLGDAELGALAAWAVAHDVRLVSDEIYHGITYGPTSVTARGHDPQAVVVGSFSKYFSMTGWRLGWLVLPPELVTPVERLAQHLTIAPATLPQLAAVSAFGATGELDAHVRRYADNRAVLLDGLAAMDVDVAPSDGAFYLWVPISGHPLLGAVGGSSALCARWLDEAGVAATPGIDFDPARGEDYVRLSFAGSTADMADAVARLRTWLASGASAASRSEATAAGQRSGRSDGASAASRTGEAPTRAGRSDGVGCLD